MAVQARPTDKNVCLLHMLTVEAGVSEAVAKWAIEDPSGPECEPPADFAKLWSPSTVADGPKVDILASLSPPISAVDFKGRKLAGRLQAAWGYCQGDHAGEAVQRAAPPKPEDEFEESPWPEPRKLSCHAEVQKESRQKMDPDSAPPALS